MYQLTYYDREVGCKEDVLSANCVADAVAHVLQRLGRSKGFKIETKSDDGFLLRIHEGDLVIASIEPATMAPTAADAEIVEAITVLGAGNPDAAIVRLFGGTAMSKPMKALTDAEVRAVHDLSKQFWNRLTNAERQELRNEAARWTTAAAATA